MARPEKTSEVTERYNRIATYELAFMMTQPALMKAYTAMCEAAQKMGGRVRSTGTSVTVEVLKTGEQLRTELEYEQRQWDRMEDSYQVAFNRDPDDLGAASEWDKERIQNWAEANGKPDPWAIALHDDPELDAMRTELGMAK